MSFTVSDAKTIIDSISSITSLGIQITQAIRQAHQITSMYGLVRLQKSTMLGELFDIVLEVGYKVGVSGERDHLVTVKSEVVGAFGVDALNEAMNFVLPIDNSSGSKDEKKDPTSALTVSSPHVTLSTHPIVGLLKAAVQNLATKWLGIKMTSPGLLPSDHLPNTKIHAEILVDVQDSVFNPIHAYLQANNVKAKHPLVIKAFSKK